MSTPLRRNLGTEGSGSYSRFGDSRDHKREMPLKRIVFDLNTTDGTNQKTGLLQNSYIWKGKGNTGDTFHLPVIICLSSCLSCCPFLPLSLLVLQKLRSNQFQNPFSHSACCRCHTHIHSLPLCPLLQITRLTCFASFLFFPAKGLVYSLTPDVCFPAHVPSSYYFRSSWNSFIWAVLVSCIVKAKTFWCMKVHLYQQLLGKYWLHRFAVVMVANSQAARLQTSG